MVGPGTYEDVEITGSALTKGKSTDDPVVEVYFLVEGEPMTAWLYTTPKAWEWTEKKLRACGFDPAEHQFNLVALNLDGDANPIKGNRTRIVVREEEYEGKIRPKIAFIGDFDGGEKMPDAEAVQFTQALRQRLLASQGKPAAAANRATTKVGSAARTTSAPTPTGSDPF